MLQSLEKANSRRVFLRVIEDQGFELIIENINNGRYPQDSRLEFTQKPGHRFKLKAPDFRRRFSFLIAACRDSYNISCLRAQSGLFFTRCHAIHEHFTEFIISAPSRVYAATQPENTDANRLKSQHVHCEREWLHSLGVYDRSAVHRVRSALLFHGPEQTLLQGG